MGNGRSGDPRSSYQVPVRSNWGDVGSARVPLAVSPGYRYALKCVQLGERVQIAEQEEGKGGGRGMGSEGGM